MACRIGELGRIRSLTEQRAWQDSGKAGPCKGEQVPFTWARRVSRRRRTINRPESLARRVLIMMESLAGGRVWQEGELDRQLGGGTGERHPREASGEGVREARYMRVEGQSEMEKEQDQ